MAGNGTDTVKQNYALIQYFGKKTNYSPSYAPVATNYEYLTDSMTNKPEFIITHVYELGRGKSTTYYISKLYIDKDFKVKKVYYDQKVSQDTALFFKEFKNTIQAASILATMDSIPKE